MAEFEFNLPWKARWQRSSELISPRYPIREKGLSLAVLPRHSPQRNLLTLVIRCKVDWEIADRELIDKGLQSLATRIEEYKTAAAKVPPEEGGPVTVKILPHRECEGIFSPWSFAFHTDPPIRVELRTYRPYEKHEFPAPVTLSALTETRWRQHGIEERRMAETAEEKLAEHISLRARLLRAIGYEVIMPK